MDVNKLKGVIPDHVLTALTPDFLKKATIDGPLRLSNFLGQAWHESGNFTTLTENLNYGLAALYSTDPKKPALWQKHFKSLEDATPYARVPEKIANRIYANRMGNGDEASGDGWRFCGRGYLQLTGKTNYKLFQDWINTGNPTPVDFMKKPELLKETPYNLLSAVRFFSLNNIWAVCDKGVDRPTVEKVTKIVNGGHHGLEERIANTQKIFAALKK